MSKDFTACGPLIAAEIGVHPDEVTVDDTHGVYRVVVRSQAFCQGHGMFAALIREEERELTPALFVRKAVARLLEFRATKGAL